MTTFKPLKVALVGCGAVSQLYYAPALQQLERIGQIQVAALFDPNPANLTSIHKSFPAAVEVRDVDQLTQSGLDLAIIASPPQYHASQSIQCLQSGMSVLCEKPMALSVAEGEAMVAAASSSGGLLAVGLVRRFFPAAQTLHNILSLNIFGAVKSFSCTEGRVFQWPVQSVSYFRDNGVLRDIGVHILDLLMWWWGEPEEIVYEDDAMGGAELNCRIRLRFPQGFTGEVRLSREFQLPNSYVIQCQNVTINWDLDETNQLRFTFDHLNYSLSSEVHPIKSINNGLIVPGPIAADFHECFHDQLRNVIAAVHRTEPVMVSGETGLASLRAIEQCYSQRTLMKMPWLNEQEILRAEQIKERR